MKRRSLQAFTVSELLIALALGSFFAVGIFKLIRSHVVNSTDQLTVSENSRSSQRARSIVMADLEEAGFDPRYVDLGRAQITPFTVASNDRFTTQGDFNMNGTINGTTVTPPETVAYLYDAATGNVTRNGNVLLAGVLTFAVTYYNSTGSTTSTLSQIKKVRIQWTQKGEGDKTLAQEIVVNVRNYH